jgi:hypothetical protein
MIAHTDDREAQRNIAKMRSGHGVALVTVGMAYEGMDAPNISHIAALTYYRSKPWIDQMLARGTRRGNALRGDECKANCTVFFPDDRFAADIIAQIRAEQLVVVDGREEEEPGLGNKRNGGGAGGGGVAGNGVIPLDGTMTTTRMSALDDEAFELSPGHLAWMETQNAAVTSYADIARVLRTLGHPIPEIAVPDFNIPIRNYEKKMRDAIEGRCRRIDVFRQAPWGTTNKDMKGKFGKSREDMDQRELGLAWAWLERSYPVPGRVA